MSTITSTAGHSFELSPHTELPTLKSIHEVSPDLTLAVSLGVKPLALCSSNDPDPEAENPEWRIQVQCFDKPYSMQGTQSSVPESFEPDGEIKQIVQSLQQTLQRQLEHELKSHLPLSEGPKPTFGGLCGPHRKEVDEFMSRATRETVAAMTGIDEGRNVKARDYQKGDAATWISFVPGYDYQKDPLAQKGLSVHTTRQSPSQYPCRYASDRDSPYNNCNVKSILTNTAKPSERLSGMFNKRSLQIGLILTEGGPLHRDRLTWETRCNVQLTDNEKQIVSLIGEALCNEVCEEFKRSRKTEHRSDRNNLVDLQNAVCTTRFADGRIPFCWTAVVSEVVKRPSLQPWWKRNRQ